MATSTHQPAMRAFTVIKREGQDDFWLAAGGRLPSATHSSTLKRAIFARS